MELYEKAVAFALERHQGMRRKLTSLPYILHPLETSVIASTVTADAEVLAAALLHDTLEDTSTSKDEIKAEFGERVLALVMSETENKRRDLPPEQSWRIRKEEALQKLKNADDIGVKIVWLSDKLSNMRSLYRTWKTEKDNVWQSFHMRDLTLQAWYYRSVAEYTKELNGTDAWREYNTIIEKIFEGVK